MISAKFNNTFKGSDLNCHKSPTGKSQVQNTSRKSLVSIEYDLKGLWREKFVVFWWRGTQRAAKASSYATTSEFRGKTAIRLQKSRGISREVLSPRGPLCHTFSNLKQVRRYWKDIRDIKFCIVKCTCIQAEFTILRLQL